MNSNSIRTPFPRLIAGISIGSFGYNIAMVIPLAFLLTLKLAMLEPANVTLNFSIIGLVTGITGIFSQYLAGVISDRTTLAFGRRRPWILIGAIGAAASLEKKAKHRNVSFQNRLFPLIFFLEWTGLFGTPPLGVIYYKYTDGSPNK